MVEDDIEDGITTVESAALLLVTTRLGLLGLMVIDVSLATSCWSEAIFRVVIESDNRIDSGNDVTDSCK